MTEERLFELDTQTLIQIAMQMLSVLIICGILAVIVLLFSKLLQSNNSKKENSEEQ